MCHKIMKPTKTYLHSHFLRRIGNKKTYSFNTTFKRKTITFIHKRINCNGKNNV